MQSAMNPYDAVAYPGCAFPHTHPGRMAAMAALHGLSAAPAESCRVLEIACGDGANLIPMAYAIPTSEFVGFDLARLPIERGQARIGELGLGNARLFQANLLDIGKELGQFDYMIAHGLYAWVPEPVRDRLMAMCADLLAPEGVAFISYNALPGGFVRNAIGTMMQFRMGGSNDVEQQVAGAMGFVRELLAVRPEGDAFRLLLEGHLDTMEDRSANAIYHDELCEVAHPVWFVEFAEHAVRHGLQYLCEAVLPPPSDPCYRYEIRAELEKASGGDNLKLEQMLDFARARKYRETLLCRTGRTVHRDYSMERFTKLCFASPAASGPDAAPGTTAFTLPGGMKMESNHPLVRLLLGELERVWPRAIQFEELEQLLAVSGFALNADAATLLMRLAVAKFIEMRGWDAPVASEIPRQPKASACSRQEIRHQPQATTLLHSTVRLEDPIARRFLTLLDGTRDRVELAAVLRAEFPDEPAENIDLRIEPALDFYLRAGFLEG